MSFSKVIRTLIRKSIQQEMAFRANFFINLLNTLLGLLGGLGGVLILFCNRQELNGWTLTETLALFGVYLVVQALKDLAFGPSMNALAGLGGELWTGSFDFTLLKPVPTQAYVSIRKWSLWSLFDLLLGLGILAYAFIALGQTVTVLDILLFMLSMLVSLSIVYAILLFLGSAAFWYLGTPLLWIYESIMQMGRFPVGVYPGFLKLVLTWVIPVGFMVSVPAQAIMGKLGMGELLGGIVLAAVMVLLASLFFRKSLKRYSSASS
ncbi:MAG: ABC-2 family transporter protein [Clostridia bacterium]|nr:ABC-2 family transporter protein [Clostridia bacterium]